LSDNISLKYIFGFMELRHLRYFIAVADELSFSRAAERLQMAQPPLSQQIQALEMELGVRLFDRKSRPLQITQAGQVFLAEARITIENLAQAVTTTQLVHQGELGYLKVGFTSSMANGILPTIMCAFQQQYPSVKLILCEKNCNVQIQGLRDRDTDIAFVYQDYKSFESHDLDVLQVSQEPLVVVLPEKHQLTNKSEISIADLANEELVMPLSNVVSDLAKQIEYLFAQAGLKPKVSQQALFMVTILGLVAGGMGISILPASVQNLQRQGVIYRPIREKTTTNQLIAVWRQDDSSPILQQFLDVTKAVSQLPSSTSSNRS
jgi:DNA-binding transcriptional LysR family regulator